MNIFELLHENDQAYLYAPTAVCERCVPEPPRSIAAGWVPPTLTIAGSDERRAYLPKTDFPGFFPDTAVLSERAVKRLHSILTPCGELLPIHLSNDRDTFYLFNVTRVINAVDMQRSKFLELPSGAIGPCERLVLDPAKIPLDALFFKITQMGPANRIYATQQAVEAVKKSDLSGYDFTLAWSDD